MFPFALINEVGSQTEKIFRVFAKKVNDKIFPSFEKLIINDSWDYLRKLNLILDAKTPLELLQEIRAEYGEYIDPVTLKKIIDKNLHLLDSWAVAQINKDLETQREALINRGVDGKEIDRRIPLIPKDDPFRVDRIPLASRNSQLIQNQSYAKHFNEVEDLITDGIISGKSSEEIQKDILDKVDMNANRARFWAEDQAAIFHAEQNRIASVRAGYTHYEWVNSGSNTRASHAIHNGKVVAWNVGVNNLTRPGARHAGEDYRCHCKTRNLTQEELAKRGVTNTPDPRGPQGVEGLVENYTGTEEVKAAKILTDDWAKKNLMNNYNPKEIDGLNAWQSGYYASIDQYFEGEQEFRTQGQIGTLENRITAIDEAIDKSVLPIELTVKSGVEAEKYGIVFEDVKIGEIIQPRSFLPTTTSEAVAKTFTDSSKIIYEIVLPKGSKGVYMNNVTKLKPHEKEIILPRNRKYKVIDKYEKNGYKYLKMEIEQYARTSYG